MSYIGVTSKLVSNRLRGHLNGKSWSLLSKAIREYGIDKFTTEIIEQVSDKEKALALEQHYIETRSTKHPHGYNSIGGKKAVTQEDLSVNVIYQRKLQMRQWLQLYNR